MRRWNTMKIKTKILLADLTAMVLVLALSLYLVAIIGGLRAIACEVVILVIWILGERSGYLDHKFGHETDTNYFFAKSAQNRGEKQCPETVDWLKKQDGMRMFWDGSKVLSRKGNSIPPVEHKEHYSDY